MTKSNTDDTVEKVRLAADYRIAHNVEINRGGKRRPGVVRLSINLLVDNDVESKPRSCRDDRERINFSIHMFSLRSIIIVVTLYHRR